MIDISEMFKNCEKKIGPLVSVLIPTFNRRRYLPQALTSALRQSYRNLQIIVINDGGQDISDIISSFEDSRIILINRKQNRGKAFSLNEALTKAEGKYIAYLDDDDLYYPNHIEILVDALENQTDCRVAYSDLYKAHCKVMPDGTRQILSKVVEVSRDFDRFMMLYFNHALHVSLIHHRDLIEKTGPYNENLNILIDWDMTRRLAFFSDFYHICEITGEFYGPVGECDRISVQHRKDKKQYARNLMAIRTTRPPKPWTKIKDMSIIFVSDHLDQQAGTTLGLIWRHTFYPYMVYLPMPQAELDRINTDMPNLTPIPVSPFSSQAEQIDTALKQSQGQYITIVPNNFTIEEMWVEDPLYALINSSVDREAIQLEASTPSAWAAVLRKSDLMNARRKFPNLPVHESLKADGVIVRPLRPEEISFQFDHLLQQAQSAEKDGNWVAAARMFEYIAENYQNDLWMKALAAKAFFKAGCHTRAAELSRQVNQRRPTVDTLLLEAKVNRKQKDFNLAIELLERAKQILEDPFSGFENTYEALWDQCKTTQNGCL